MQNKFGALLSKYDPRDWGVKLIRAEFPEIFRAKKKPMVFDQQAGNCVMQAFRALLWYIFGVIYGVNFGYGGARSHQTSGLHPNEAANFICKFGLPPLEKDTTYIEKRDAWGNIIGKVPKELEVVEVIDYYNRNRAELEKLAAPYAKCSWARLTTVAEVKAALMQGLLVAFCAKIKQSDPDRFGVFPLDDLVHGLHEMIALGWEPWQTASGKREMVIIQNSWGEDWGKDGEAHVSWEDLFSSNDVIAFFPPDEYVEPDDGKDYIAIRRTLRKGKTDADLDRNDHAYNDVTPLQQRLNELGYELPVTGIFDDATDKAVRAFQKACGLVIDGIVGDETWKALENPPDDPTHPELRIGDNGDSVRTMQKRLIVHGFELPNFGPDGDFGSETEDALKRFQKAKGLDDTGVCDDSTWEKLLEVPTPPDPEPDPEPEPDPDPNPEPKSKVDRFIALLRGVLGHIFVWGKNGELVVDEQWIRDAEEDPEDADRAVAFWKKQLAAGMKDLQGFDCSGLMYWALKIMGLQPTDISSRGLYAACEKITRDELQKGDLLFRWSEKEQKIFHVGAYSGNHKAIEAMGRDRGVVERDLDASGDDYWNRCGRFPALLESTQRDLYLTDPRMEGEDVRQLQNRLLGLGFDLGAAGADGEYGPKTDIAVKLLQLRAVAVLQTGKADEATRKLLNI